MQSVFDGKWNSDYEPDLEQNQSYWCMCASQGITTLAYSAKSSTYGTVVAIRPLHDVLFLTCQAFVFVCNKKALKSFIRLLPQYT